MHVNEPVPAAESKRHAWARWLIGFFLYNLLIVWPVGVYGAIRQRHHDMPVWLAVAILLSVAGWLVGIRMLLRAMASESGAPNPKEPRV